MTAWRREMVRRPVATEIRAPIITGIIRKRRETTPPEAATEMPRIVPPAATAAKTSETLMLASGWMAPEEIAVSPTPFKKLRTLRPRMLLTSTAREVMRKERLTRMAAMMMRGRIFLIL